MDVKGEVSAVLIPWIRTVRLQLRERFGTDLPVLRLHSVRGGGFSSDLQRDFCRGEGILQSFTLPDSPQENGIAERHIGLVMELNLWPRVSLPETSPTLHWTGKVGDASVFRIWGSRAFVCDTSADKLSARAIPYVFLGFVADAPGWQFYDPTSRRVLPSHDTLSLVLHLFQVAVNLGAAPGAASGGAGTGGAEPRGAGSEGAGFGGAEPEGVEPGGAEPEGAESEGAVPRAGGGAVTTVAGSTGGSVATGPGGARTSGAGAAGTGGVGCAGAGDPTELGAAGAGGAGAGGAGVGGPDAGGAEAAGAGAVDPSAGGAGGTVRPRSYFVPLLQQVLGVPSSTGLPPPFLCPPPDQSQLSLQPASPLPTPSPYTEQSGGLLERREPASRLVSPVRTARRTSRSRPPPVPGTHAMALHPSSVLLHVPLPAPPESSLPEVPDPASDRARAASPTDSRLLTTAITDPSFESASASALVAELLDFAAACRLDYATALVAESVSASPPSVGGECALSTDVLEDRKEDFECFAADVPRFASMVLAPEGDPDAPDIPTLRSYAEAIMRPYSSQWQASMNAEMASWKSTDTYVDEDPPSRANIVDGMWIFRVKRPPGSPPAFKARYVARGFNHRQGVDYFQAFSPTPKMTTLRVLLHVAAQRDYELHSLDFSTAFLQGSLHEEIWLRRPPAPREWDDTLRTTLAALGFAPSTADPSLFLRTDTSLPPFYVLVYVDDLVFATADTEAVTLLSALQLLYLFSLPCCSPDIPTPRSYAEVITGPYSSQWQAAMDAKMAFWKSTSTYVDEVPPPGANIVNDMWIFRVKWLSGSLPAFKTRYVARGFSQRQGVDYFQTFSPTLKMTTLRVFLHIAAQRDYELHSLDFSTAFLHGSLHEEIWLRHPPGFTGSFSGGTQWSLWRPDYSLRQAPREWHDTLRTTLATLGFAPSTADPSLFLRTNTLLPPFYVLMYVDDLVFATADTEALTLVKSELQKRDTCTVLGKLRGYLGLQITRDRARRTITLTQSYMVHQVLQRFGFQFSSPQPPPLSTSHSLSAPPSDESLEPSGPYPELVGCLMYLMTCTRPDLAYPLSLLARYVAPGRHRKVHWDAAKRVLRYLCSTLGMGLVLGGRGPVVLIGHADASWVDDSATQRSSQGYTFSLGSGSISWWSNCSSLVLISSCEAEIYAGAMAAQELRWLTYLVTDLGEQPRSPPVLYVDNKAMIALCQKHRLEHKTKHIALRYFLARELQERGQLRLAYVATRANTVDVFTKALPPGDHQRFATVLGLVPTLPHLLTA
ncbi:unnamed protein product [Closterium sp. NIES-54]